MILKNIIKKDFLILSFLFSLFVFLNHLAVNLVDYSNYKEMCFSSLLWIPFFFFLLLLLRTSILFLFLFFLKSKEQIEFYFKHEHFTYYTFLLIGLGAFGINVNTHFLLWLALIFFVFQISLVFLPKDTQSKVFSSLFFLSGFAALIYQIVWQRILFTSFGVNIESVTIIVSIFMFGLGVGSIIGGKLSEIFKDKLPLLFLICEICIGIFGIFSKSVIQLVNQLSLDGSLLTVSIAIYAILAIPTCLMGATLPILVSHLHKQLKHVGKTVGTLYFFNTLGSAIACFLTADILFVLLGQREALLIAVLFNFIVGIGVYIYIQTAQKNSCDTENINTQKENVY